MLAFPWWIGLKKKKNLDLQNKQGPPNHLSQSVYKLQLWGFSFAAAELSFFLAQVLSRKDVHTDTAIYDRKKDSDIFKNGKQVVSKIFFTNIFK